MQNFCCQLMIETQLLKHSKATSLNKTFLLSRIYEIKIDFNLQCKDLLFFSLSLKLQIRFKIASAQSQRVGVCHPRKVNRLR